MTKVVRKISEKKTSEEPHFKIKIYKSCTELFANLLRPDFGEKRHISWPRSSLKYYRALFDNIFLDIPRA